MKQNLVGNLSANVLQLVLNQVFGLVIFYVLSTGLDKNHFGQINLALAILLAAFNILSMGIDQLIIKRVASGHPVQSSLSLYLFHVLVTGGLFYGILISGRLLFASNQQTYNLILLIGIGKLMIFLSTPFKQVANGMEKFKLLAQMSVISNAMRSISLVGIALFHSLSLHTIILVFIVGDVAELILGVILFKQAVKVRLAVYYHKASYFSLVREALPQTGVVLITSALARFDWIFIGLILSAVKLAEYSFAYKVFEMATLPLLAIAPLLIPRFTKMVQAQNIPVDGLRLLVRIEMVVAALMALLINSYWAPVIDGLTADKYGLVNVKTIFILSLCMPFLYINNFLWTIYFAQGRLKMILTAFIITLAVNVVGDLALIAPYKNEGAAFAFLLSCAAQTIYFFSKNNIQGLGTLWQPLVISTTCALVSGFAAHNLPINTWLSLPAAILIYVALLFLTSQLKATDGHQIKALIKG
ncbi:MAG: oligosaccharide flippase family protein [Mucilaginibacter sp.]